MYSSGLSFRSPPFKPWWRSIAWSHFLFSRSGWFLSAQFVRCSAICYFLCRVMKILSVLLWRGCCSSIFCLFPVVWINLICLWIISELNEGIYSFWSFSMVHMYLLVKFKQCWYAVLTLPASFNCNRWALFSFLRQFALYEMCRSSVLDSGVWTTTGYTVSSLCSCLFSLNQLSWRAGCELWQSCDKCVWITRHSWFTVVGSKLS